jgi:hypothetical protein
MPHKIYRHPCEHGRRGLAVCPECGTPGVYDGWGYSVVEMMCRYALRSGLSPMGPHLRYANEVYEGAFCRCLRCAGRGTLILPDESYQPCPRCHGDGVRPALPGPEIAALRDRVLERYPDARSPRKEEGSSLRYPPAPPRADGHEE